MGTNVIAVMRFVHDVRRDFFESAATLGWKEFTRDRGVSLGSFRSVFLHLATVEDQHVTQFCEGKPTPWPASLMKIPTDEYRNLPEVRRRLASVTKRAEASFRKWDTPRALAKPVVWMAGPYPVRVTRDTALMQCATEHLFHLGEVEAMLWQLDRKPPTTLWIEREVLNFRWPPPKRMLAPQGKRPKRATPRS